jgi:predicted GNAT family N-acyltransferase
LIFVIPDNPTQTNQVYGVPLPYPTLIIPAIVFHFGVNPTMARAFITKVQSSAGHSLTLPTASDPTPSRNPPIINDALTVRLKVFVDEEGFDPAVEIDSDDARSWHWTVYDNTEPANPVPVATARMIPPPQVPPERLVQSDKAVSGPKYDLLHEPAIRLGRLACLKEYRGYGLARKLNETILTWAREHPAEINRAYMKCLQEVGRDVQKIPGEKWSGLVIGYVLAHLEKFYMGLGFNSYGPVGFWDGFENCGIWMRLDIKRETHL